MTPASVMKRFQGSGKSHISDLHRASPKMAWLRLCRITNESTLTENCYSSLNRELRWLRNSVYKIRMEACLFRTSPGHSGSIERNYIYTYIDGQFIYRSFGLLSDVRIGCAFFLRRRVSRFQDCHTHPFY